MTGLLLKSKGEEITENIKMDDEEDELGDLLNENDIEELLMNEKNYSCLDEESKKRIRMSYLDDPV